MDERRPGDHRQWSEEEIRELVRDELRRAVEAAGRDASMIGAAGDPAPRELHTSAEEPEGGS